MRLLAALPPFVLLTVVTAQGPVLTTQSSVGVFARVGAQVQVDVVAPNTPITAPVRIEATLVGAAASLAAAPGLTPNGFVITSAGEVAASSSVRGEAGTTPAPANTPPLPGPVAFLLAWRGAPRNFHLAMDGDATAGGAAGVAVDVGDDGSPEFRQAVDGSAHTFDFVLGGLGATVAKVVVDGHAQTPPNALRAGYQVRVNLDAGPEVPPCRFTNYGLGCGDLSLAGTDRVIGVTHNIELSVRGGFPNLPVVLMFGERPLDLPIPGFEPCRLLVNPVVTVPIQADQNGNMDNTFLVGPELEGQLFVQALVLRRGAAGFELKTSNGARMACGL